MIFFSMNLLQILFISLSIFMLVEETISLKEFTLYKDADRTPIAVIKKYDSTKLQLAIPHEYIKNLNYAGYYCNDSETGNGPKEKFMIACPAFNDNQLNIQRNWRQREAASNKSNLLFMHDYEAPDVECSSNPIPSIRKVERNNNSESKMKYCSQRHAEMYEVGYPVSNDDEGTDIQLLASYTICYLKDVSKGATLYTIHRIEPSNLLFQNQVEELPELNPLNEYYESFLDSSLSSKKEFKSKKYHVYQFVRVDDMPTRSWKQTTQFLFNYTLITRNVDLFKGMVRADFYIKLYSKMNNKPLTLYSGTYQKLTLESIVPCWLTLCRPTLVDFFTRLIINDEGHAIILVTQHNLKSCGPVYLCDENHILKLKSYQDGGCIYTCSLDKNDHLLRQLDLPPLEITGLLDFTFKALGTETMSSEEGRSSDSKSLIKIDILDFLNDETLLDAVTKVYEVTGRNWRYQNTPDPNNGES